MSERELPYAPPRNINLRDIERQLERARQDGSWPRYALGNIIGRVYAQGYSDGHLEGFQEAHDQARDAKEPADD